MFSSLMPNSFKQPAVWSSRGAASLPSNTVEQILSLSNQNIYIEYANDFRNALNGASATSIVAFEVLRQRSN